MESLINQKILKHEGMVLLTEAEITNYLSQLKGGWQLMENPPSHEASEGRFAKLQKQFNFSDFDHAMEFVNKVADIAKKENHHPDICISFKEVEITLWSHHVNGLSINDFIIAAKIDLI